MERDKFRRMMGWGILGAILTMWAVWMLITGGF